MSHVEPDRLALFALGEPGVTQQESEHLVDCAVCLDELEALRHAASAGRASMDIGQLESAPEVVWERIAAELSLASASGRHRRKRAAWRGRALAASFVLLAGIGLGVWAFSQQRGLTEVAEATLAAFPDHPGAEGSAIVEERPDGTLELRVTLSADAAPDTFREVWLITADASELVSLGTLGTPEQTFAIPAGVDLLDYVLVDVSREPRDGNADHSGDSIARGEPTFL